jgi:hypothetical protein
MAAKRKSASKGVNRHLAVHMVSRARLWWRFLGARRDLHGFSPQGSMLNFAEFLMRKMTKT